MPVPCTISARSESRSRSELLRGTPPTGRSAAGARPFCIRRIANPTTSISLVDDHARPDRTRRHGLRHRDPPCPTSVGQSPTRKDRPQGSGHRSRVAYRVSRLRFGPSGAVAWISCSDGGRITDPSPNRGRACRSQIASTVSTSNPQGPVPDRTSGGPERPPTLLDSGRGIDALSLSVSKTRVIWRRHGKLRSAPIPPPRDPPLDS